MLSGIVAQRSKEIRNKILNTSFLVFTILSFPLLVLSMSRSSVTGWSVVYYYQIFLFLSLLVMTIFRKRLSDNVKIYGLLILIFSLATIGFYNFGQLSNAKLFFVLGIVFSGLFLPRKFVIGTIVAYVLIFVVIMWLYLSGTLEIGFDVDQYLLNPASWGSAGLAVLLIAVGILLINNLLVKTQEESFNHMVSVEAMAAEEKNISRGLINSLPGIFYLYDQFKGDWKLVRWNKNHEVITGYNSSELYGATPKLFFNEKDRNFMYDTIKELMHSGKATLETEIRTKSGQMIPFYFEGYKLNDRQFMGVGLDISEMKVVQEELEKHKNHLEEIVENKTRDLKDTNQALQETVDKLKLTQAQLVQSEKMASLGLLSAGLAHEINNPLNYINGGVLGLKRRLDISEDKELRDYLDLIDEGVSRTTSIVKSLDKFGNKSEEMDALCDIHEILGRCLNILNNRISGRIKVETKFSKQKFYIKGNESHLHQVMLSILTNAVQAIEGDGSILITTRAENRLAIIEIKDDGTGISASNLKYVFDAFYTTKEPGEGTGLGLTTSYSIIKDHNGDISINSKEKKGTTVTCTFPIAASQ